MLVTGLEQRKQTEKLRVHPGVVAEMLEEVLVDKEVLADAEVLVSAEV